MSEIDQQFVEYVVKSLVGKPDAVEIKRTIDEKGVLLELTVDPEDLGRVIGKRGATAQSLRTLLRALGTKNDARYNLKIVDNGAPVSKPADDTAASSDSVEEPASNTVDDEPVAEASPEQEPATDKLGDEPEENREYKREEETSDRLSRTRAELSDLDDLDI